MTRYGCSNARSPASRDRIRDTRYTWRVDSGCPLDNKCSCTSRIGLKCKTTKCKCVQDSRFAEEGRGVVNANVNTHPPLLSRWILLDWSGWRHRMPSTVNLRITRHRIATSGPSPPRRRAQKRGRIAMRPTTRPPVRSCIIRKECQLRKKILFTTVALCEKYACVTRRSVTFGHSRLLHSVLNTSACNCVGAEIDGNLRAIRTVLWEGKYPNEKWKSVTGDSAIPLEYFCKIIFVNICK